MAVYEYKAIDLDASALAGTVIADTPRQARDILRERGLTIAEVKPVEEGAKVTFGRRRRARRSRGEVVAFVRELATLLTAGIPLLSALETLTRQHRGHFRAVIQDLADRVAAGSGLAEAMERHGAYFDELSVSIVQVGQSTGALDAALRRLADFREKAHRLRSRVVTALIYPAVVCVIGLAVCIFLMTYVVPNLLGTLTQAGRKLPAVTQAVKAASDFLLGWWWALLGAAAAIAAAVRAVLRTEAGRTAADRLFLRVPVLGTLVRKENTSRIAVVLATLLAGGLQFVEAVRITRRTIRNRVYRDALEDYEKAVTAGGDVAGPLAATGAFSPLVVQMLAVGQQSGDLEGMLSQLADAYDQEVAVATQRLTALLEPLLIVVLAILVGVIAFATILPILEAGNVL